MARTIPIQKLIDAIEHTNDDDIIIDLYHRLGLAIDSNINYKMTDAEILGVNEGIEQIRNGETETHEEVMKKAKKWAKK